jgi:2-phosphosulfolactate phosphatase
MITGLASGVPHILPFDNLEACKNMKSQGYITAGERGGQKVPEFDMGNSPYSYMEVGKEAKPVAVTTTNGTRAIQMSSKASLQIIGAFLNISATEHYLVSQEKDILILCAAWKGKVNLEDTLYAGALANRLLEKGWNSEDDATLVSSNLFRNQKDDLLGILTNSSHVHRLKKFGIEKDITFSLKIDQYDLVAGIRNGKIVRL